MPYLCVCIELYSHRFARRKAPVRVMVMGPWVNRKAAADTTDDFKDAAATLDNKLEAAGSKGRLWNYVRVGCGDAPYLDKRHFSPAGSGQILKAHTRVFNKFFE